MCQTAPQPLDERADQQRADQQRADQQRADQQRADHMQFADLLCSDPELIRQNSML